MNYNVREKNPNCKLSVEQVRHIITECQPPAPRGTKVRLARELGVSLASVSRIVSGLQFRAAQPEKNNDVA